MKRTFVLSMLAAIVFAFPQIVGAEVEEATATRQCPDGQVAVTFADGNNLTTVCVDSGAGMDETVSTGVEIEDPSNYD